MDAFEYAKPSSVKEALGLLGSDWDDASVFAGGTDLISLLKDDVEDTKRLVNIKGIAGLNRVRESAEGVHIGAAVTVEELVSNPMIRERFPAIVDAAEGIRSPQLHNMSTVGGWLCQRPRCWYYRNGFGLLALDKDGNSLVAQGDNRYHAIFGNSGPAKFISPSSFGPVLMALGGEMRIEGPKGARNVAAGDFFVIPQKPGEREHAIAPDEIVTEITIPAASRGMRNALYEVRPRKASTGPSRRRLSRCECAATQSKARGSFSATSRRSRGPPKTPPNGSPEKQSTKKTPRRPATPPCRAPHRSAATGTKCSSRAFR